jgi:hypothetical protein
MVLGRVAGRPVVRVARRVVAGRAGVRGVGVGRCTRVRRWRVGAIRRGRGVMRRRAIGAAIRAGSEGRRAHENLREHTPYRMPCACRAHAVRMPRACLVQHLMPHVSAMASPRLEPWHARRRAPWCSARASPPADTCSMIHRSHHTHCRTLTASEAQGWVGLRVRGPFIVGMGLLGRASSQRSSPATRRRPGCSYGARRHPRCRRPALWWRRRRG